MLNFCFKNCRNSTQNAVGNQQVTDSQNTFLVIVSKLIKLSMLLYCSRVLFGSRPVNHILLSEQSADFLCRKRGRIQLFFGSLPLSLCGYQRVSGEVLVSVNVMGDVSCGRSVCCWLEAIHQPDLLGAERSALVKSVSQSRPAFHIFETRLQQVHALPPHPGHHSQTNTVSSVTDSNLEVTQ